MEKGYNEINIDDIKAIAIGIKMMYDNQEKRDRDEIFASMREGKSTKGELLSKNTEKYKNERRKDPILNLANKLEMMKRIADKKHKLDGVYELIKDTNDKKAIKAIEVVIRGCIKENQNIYEESNKIMSEKEIKRPLTTHEEDMYVVKYVNITSNGFDIDKGYPDGKDGYSDIFSIAFRNQDNDIYESKYVKEPEKDPIGYVTNEIEEIENIEKFWQTDEFENYVTRLESEDPKKAQKYKSAQLKRQQEIRKLAKLYEEIAEPKASKEKIQNAINELRNKKAFLPEKVFRKVEKRLLAQKAKEDKKVQKIEKKANNIINRIGIKQSINNAKEYANVIEELKSMVNQQTLEDSLIKMEVLKKQAEKELQDEYSKSKVIPEERIVQIRGGDAYETGEVKPASRTNISAINEAKRKVEEINKKIAEIEEEIQQNIRKKEELENKKNNIANKEIETTIKRTKLDPKALKEPEPPTTVENNATNTKRNVDFVPKYEIDPKIVHEIYNEPTHNNVKEEDDRTLE